MYKKICMFVCVDYYTQVIHIKDTFGLFNKVQSGFIFKIFQNIFFFQS